MIIILDKSTGLPIEPQRPPIDGDWVEENKDGEIKRYEWHEEIVIPSPISIIITAITGDLQHSSNFTKATCYENTTITIDGTLAIPDQSFAMPIRRNDGRLFLFKVDVVGGIFSAKINFPTSGAFVYSDEEANKDLPQKMFTVNTINFDVLRQVI